MQRTMVIMLMIMAGCTGSAERDSVSTSPAPPGGSQTAATGAVPRLVKLASGLDHPIGLEFAPGQVDRMYVVEQPGRIIVLRGGRRVGRPVLDLRGRVATANEQGLLGLAFHPRFEQNGLIYVNYTDSAGDTRVVEYQVRDGAADERSARELLLVDQPASNHNGGDLEFGPDGLLYIGLGDGGGSSDTAQDPASLLGKLLRIDVDMEDPRVEVYALGLRNPWRTTFDRETGDLWIGDVGQSAWEEIDRLAAGAPAGANFGWNAYEGFARYEDGVEIDPTRLVEPVHVYSGDRGCAVTGGYVYRGNRLPSLRGSYLFADYCAGLLMALGTGGEVRPLALPAVPELASFAEDEDGELYVVSRSGVVYRIDPTS